MSAAPSGASALVTGAASGIGRALALGFASRGYAITLLDMDSKGLRQTASDVKAAVPSARVHTQVLDVCDSKAQDAAFADHVARYGAMDVAVLNAGIAERGSVLDPKNPQQGGWQTTLDVDLTAVIAGIRAAALCMQGSRGTIISVASAGAFFPMPVAPVYAASKAGVLHFTRSVAGPLAKQGIKVMVVCPEFVDTPLVRNVMDEDAETAKKLLGGSLDIPLLSPKMVAEATLKLLEPDTRPGTCILIRQDGSVELPFARKDKQGSSTKGSWEEAAGATARGRGNQAVALALQQQQQRAAWVVSSWPASYSKIQVQKLSSSFREAATIVRVPLLQQGQPPPPGMLLLRRVAVGINASDINYTNGRYYGSKKAAEAKLPFDAGFETVSVVAAVGPGVQGLAVGDAVATMTYDGFAEWALTPAKVALKVPRATSDMVALLTSGLTASIALSEVAKLKAGETVLVTAAAGGTGQFAVQLAKLAGCHVIATCGGAEKVAMLRRLGADRVVDYKKEQLKDVLRKEYPKGVDVVYEAVGGAMFEAALDSLADKGRLLVIGMMGAYAEGWPLSNYPGMCEKLLWKSAAVMGFFLLRYAQHFRSHLTKLTELLDAGRLQVSIDPTRFVGIEAVPEAVDWLYSGKSVGKVVVQLAKEVPCSTASRL